MAKTLQAYVWHQASFCKSHLRERGMKWEGERERERCMIRQVELSHSVNLKWMGSNRSYQQSHPSGNSLGDRLVPLFHDPILTSWISGNPRDICFSRIRFWSGLLYCCADIETQMSDILLSSSISYQLMTSKESSCWILCVVLQNND